MPNKSISLSGEVHISTEQVYTTVDALEALKAIGLAYGLYSRAEELRGQRVHLTGGEGHTALVAVSYTHLGHSGRSCTQRSCTTTI